MTALFSAGVGECGDGNDVGGVVIGENSGLDGGLAAAVGGYDVMQADLAVWPGIHTRHRILDGGRLRPQSPTWQCTTARNVLCCVTAYPPRLGKRTSVVGCAWSCGTASTKR